MAKKQKEEVVLETAKEQKLDDKVGKIKVKKKPSMKKLNKIDDVIKVDLSKPLKTKEDAVSERKTEEIPVDETPGDSGEVGKEESPIQTKEQESIQTEEVPVLEEITKEEQEKQDKIEEEVKEVAIEAEKAIEESIQKGKPLPEQVEKLISFMEETGGDLNDYVNLNQDFSSFDNHTLLKEYYKKTKPHLSGDEIDFLMEDQFSYDEETDDERSVKRKKLALKEQVASAKDHLDGLKSRYYEDLKAGNKLTGEQQKAWKFFNDYKRKSAEKSTTDKKQHRTFLNRTDELFNNEFKGFEYNVGERKFRFNVKDTDSVKNSQIDINNFIRKFLNENNEMSDAKGYHKSLFTAMNPDAIANHFYEQGKADALKQSVAKSKNISMDPRQQHSGEVNAGGIKVRVLGDDSNDFKFKINKNR